MNGFQTFGKQRGEYLTRGADESVNQGAADEESRGRSDSTKTKRVLKLGDGPNGPELSLRLPSYPASCQRHRARPTLMKARRLPEL